MSKTPSHCPFCDLIGGAAEVSVCYEDDTTLAFMDIQPVNPGHTLVVPKRHYESLRDTPPDVVTHLFAVATRLAQVVGRVTKAEGMNMVVNSGAAAGQDVFHYHVHVIPRRADDGFDIPLPFPGSQMPERERLETIAGLIVSSLRNPVGAGR